MYVRLGVFVPQWLHQDSLNLLFSKMVSLERLISYNCIETSLTFHSTSALLLMITSLNLIRLRKHVIYCMRAYFIAEFRSVFKTTTTKMF